MPGPSARENGKKGGRPKGTTGILHKSTIDKELHREVLRQLVVAQLEPMTKAQIAHAQGIDHFFMRHPKTKQFEQVTDPKLIAAVLNSGDRDSYYWVFSKDPSVQAYTALLDRALDKPIERQEVSGPNGGPMEFTERLHAARRRSRQS